MSSSVDFSVVWPCRCCSESFGLTIANPVEFWYDHAKFCLVFVCLFFQSDCVKFTVFPFQSGHFNFY